MSGANTDAKTFAMMLVMAFSEKIDSWSSYQQRGFIRGRLLIKNVLDVEEWAARYSFGWDEAALLLFDFSAAFPSIH